MTPRQTPIIYWAPIPEHIHIQHLQGEISTYIFTFLASQLTIERIFFFKRVYLILIDTCPRWCCVWWCAVLTRVADDTAWSPHHQTMIDLISPRV